MKCTATQFASESVGFCSFGSYNPWNSEQQHVNGRYKVFCVLSAVKLDNKASRINVPGLFEFEMKRSHAKHGSSARDSVKRDLGLGVSFLSLRLCSTRIKILLLPL